MYVTLTYIICWYQLKSLRRFEGLSLWDRHVALCDTKKYFEFFINFVFARINGWYKGTFASMVLVGSIVISLCIFLHLPLVLVQGCSIAPSKRWVRNLIKFSPRSNILKVRLKKRCCNSMRLTPACLLQIYWEQYVFKT